MLETKKQRKDEKEGRKEREKERGGGRHDGRKEPSRDAQANEARGEKRKAEGDEMELKRSGGQAESSSNGMAIEAIMMNDEEAWDDVRRGWLDREKVREARLEAVGHMKRKKLWDEVSRSAASGHRTVSVKWVDTNKGTEENPEKRCSLVARDFRGPSKDREDFFAATPPWELKKLLMSHAADRSDGKTRKMLLIDVKKAHLNSECTEDVQAQALALRIPIRGGGVGSALRQRSWRKSASRGSWRRPYLSARKRRTSTWWRGGAYEWMVRCQGSRPLGPRRS